MKTEKYYLILGIVTVILCTPVLGGDIVLLPRPHEPALLGPPDPILAGIEELYVVIVPPDTEPNKEGLLWKELQAKVKHKLKEVGVKIAHATQERSFDIPILRSFDIPELRVYIDMLKLADLQQYVFRIQTSLSRAVYLTKERRLLFKADVWKAEPIIQAVSVKNMPVKVTGVVLEQVEAFIHAYLAANPKGSQPVDVNSISAVPRERAKPIAKSAVAEYKYVASKNSKVFHKPECPSAKRIKPENLVGYSSRAEALKAGKRPCKICKP